jgi:hypothetical protein
MRKYRTHIDLGRCNRHWTLTFYIVTVIGTGPRLTATTQRRWIALALLQGFPSSLHPVFFFSFLRGIFSSTPDVAKKQTMCDGGYYDY